MDLYLIKEKTMKNIKIKFALPDYQDLIRYGEIESDDEYKSKNKITRIRRIRYMGILYHLNMVNDEVTCLKQWDSFPYDEDKNDIKQLSNDELANLFMFSDRDRKNNKKAERVYWLCVYEINRRDNFGENNEI